MGNEYYISFLDEEGDTLFKIYGKPMGVEVSNTISGETCFRLTLDDNSQFEIITKSVEEDSNNYIIEGWCRIEARPNGIIHQGFGTIIMDALGNGQEPNKYEIPMDLYIPPEAQKLLKKFYSSFDKV